MHYIRVKYKQIQLYQASKAKNMNLTTSFFQDFIHLIYPNLCYACLATQPPKGEIICTTCQYELQISQMHLQESNEVVEKFWGRVPIEAGGSMYSFRQASKTQQLIHHLKYKGKKEVGILLGQWYGRVLIQSSHFQKIDCIVPVPLHPKKQRIRGYNQSDQFAIGLSESMQKPWFADGLVRTVHSKSQTQKTREERFKNVANVFQVGKPAMLSGKRILLVDDVLTTGATLESCVRQLLTLRGTTVSLAVIAMSKS